jgi:NFU1 iron-sulfur cluster scaffold homolog, mitochondrial
MYAESTPNPATMKFVADVMLVSDGNTAEYVNQQEAKGSSRLAEALFNFPFVSGVFIASNFIAITKTDALQWEYVSEELKAFVLDWLQNNEVIIENAPEEREVEVTQEGNKETISSAPRIVTDTDKKIFELLEEFVRPAVESDGGAIDFQSFDEVTGTVTVVLKGACSGCPSSTATLKGGIESLLKTHMPEVQEVVALEG